MYAAGTRSLIRFSLIFATVLISCAAIAQVPVLPGETIDFRDPLADRVLPDVIDGETEFLLANAAIGTIPPVLPLSTFVRAAGPIGRANATIFQYNQIMLDPGDGTETVVTAQISGTVNIRGFLMLAGWGNVESGVTFEVIDVTFGEFDPPHVIASHTIAEYELMPDMGVGIEVGLGAKVGSATAAVAGGDLGLALEIPLSMRVVRDEIPFGFTALLQRGHTYRLQLNSSSSVKLGRGAGLATASFYNPAAVIPPFVTGPGVLITPPTLFDPDTWVASLQMPMLDKTLPSWSFPDRGIFAWDWFEDLNDTNDVLMSFGIPTTPRGLVSRYFDRIIPDEELTQPGVDLRRMQITVAPDQVELLNQISDQIDLLTRIAIRRPPPWPPSRPISPIGKGQANGLRSRR